MGPPERDPLPEARAESKRAKLEAARIARDPKLMLDEEYVLGLWNYPDTEELAREVLCWENVVAYMEHAYVQGKEDGSGGRMVEHLLDHLFSEEFTGKVKAKRQRLIDCHRLKVVCAVAHFVITNSEEEEEEDGRRQAETSSTKFVLEHATGRPAAAPHVSRLLRVAGMVNRMEGEREVRRKRHLDGLVRRVGKEGLQYVPHRARSMENCLALKKAKRYRALDEYCSNLDEDTRNYIDVLTDVAESPNPDIAVSKLGELQPRKVTGAADSTFRALADNFGSGVT